MEHVTTSLIILGTITAALLLICLIGLAISVIDAVLMRSHARGEQAAWERERRRLKEASYWFSEDPTTQKLLSDLAEDMHTDRVRDKWRANRKKENT